MTQNEADSVTDCSNPHLFSKRALSRIESVRLDGGGGKGKKAV